MMRTIISADPDSVDEEKAEALLLEIAEKRVWHPRGYNFLRRPEDRDPEGLSLRCYRRSVVP